MSINNSDSMSQKKILLSKKQLNIFRWLKKIHLNTDDDTLIFWVRKYSEKRIQDVVEYALKRRESGENIRNIGGWINYFLSKECAVEDDKAKTNRDFVKSYVDEHKWESLKIYEKYIKDTVTEEDISLSIAPDSFSYAIKSLHRRSLNYRDIFLK